MSTRAQLGVKYSDNSISGCYVHYDGYPSHMLSAIEDYVQRYTTTGLVALISEAQSCGGIRCFNAPPNRETQFLNETEIYVIDENNWGDERLHGTKYKYLVDYDTGKITHRRGDY